MAAILIVDDDAAMRGALEEPVCALGHRARITSCGREALEVFAAARIDAVLLDLRMLGMDGWRCCAGSAPGRARRR